jgi:hypothetical protein
LIFVRETSGPLTSLVKTIDQRLTMSPGKPGVYVIFLNSTDGLENRLRETAEKEALKRVSICIGAPRPDYEIAAEADITVVIYRVGQRRQEKVTANFALRKGELDECTADAIVRALSEALPK